MGTTFQFWGYYIKIKTNFLPLYLGQTRARACNIESPVNWLSFIDSCYSLVTVTIVECFGERVDVIFPCDAHQLPTQ